MYFYIHFFHTQNNYCPWEESAIVCSIEMSSAVLNCIYMLIICLLLSSADNLCKQFVSRSGPTNVGPDLDTSCNTFRCCFWKIFFKKSILKNNQQTTKTCKFPSMSSVKCQSWHLQYLDKYHVGRQINMFKNRLSIIRQKSQQIHRKTRRFGVTVQLHWLKPWYHHGSFISFYAQSTLDGWNYP